MPFLQSQIYYSLGLLTLEMIPPRILLLYGFVPHEVALANLEYFSISLLLLQDYLFSGGQQGSLL